nr:hypothetical protein [Halomicroarcula sp. XH51]
MDLNNAKIRETCTDAVFERGQDYRDEGHIQRIERFGDVVTAAVRGTNLYDVTVDLSEYTINSQCTCPYEGTGECKHVVAVLLDVVADPPQDESERVEMVIEDVSSNDLRAFVRDALAESPNLREQFLARFGDGGKSVEAYRDEIEELFNQHTQHYPVVTEAIDFSHFFEVAEQYRERERYRAAATVYRACSKESTTTTTASMPHTTTTRRPYVLRSMNTSTACSLPTQATTNSNNTPAHSKLSQCPNRESTRSSSDVRSTPSKRDDDLTRSRKPAVDHRFRRGPSTARHAIPPDVTRRRRVFARQDPGERDRECCDPRDADPIGSQTRHPRALRGNVAKSPRSRTTRSQGEHSAHAADRIRNRSDRRCDPVRILVGFRSQ